MLSVVSYTTSMETRPVFGELGGDWLQLIVKVGTFGYPEVGQALFQAAAALVTVCCRPADPWAFESPYIVTVIPTPNSELPKNGLA